MSRSFTIESSDIKFTGGRYISKEPLLAAKKAAHRLFNEEPKKSSIRFLLREMTVGSVKRVYSYVAKKNKLDEPKVIRVGDADVTYTHTYDVKACLMHTNPK